MSCGSRSELTGNRHVPLFRHRKGAKSIVIDTRRHKYTLAPLLREYTTH